MDKLVNLLVIEDNPADADLIREYLSEVTEFDAKIFHARTLKDGQNILKTNSVHAVLLDLSLPDSRGIETVKAVVNSLKTATAIVLTSLDDKVAALDAIESGAQDYLLKGSMGPDSLSRVIRYSLQRNKWLSKINEMQDQLYQSQKMESIGRLAGGMAHDFNNQLCTITILCTMIQETLPGDHVAQGYSRQILNTSNKAAELISRLLTFSRKQPANLKVVDLNKILLDTEKLLGKLIGENIQINVTCNRSAPVQISPGLMEQALMNLAINARDAMPNGGQLTFETSVTQSEPKQVVLKVTDTGVGMSAEVSSKIFEPFFTTKPVGQGTGLGLSMVYGTIKQFQGDIRVESLLGKGTSFEITLPISLQELCQETKSQQKPKAVKGSETILVVEDEKELRDTIVGLLELNGYKAVEARNGQDALRVLDEYGYRIDLIVCDITMPQMGGVELHKNVLIKKSDMRVIFMSGYSSPKTTLTNPLPQNTSYLDKPIPANVLLTKIREMLDKR